MLRYLPALLWAVLILLLTFMPGSDVPNFKIPHLDKVAHAGMYAVFSFLLLYGFRSGRASDNKLQKHAVMSAALAIGFGIVTEALQPELAPGRTFEVTDILANIIGSISGATAYLVVHLKR
jgi:VanZ family protein